ncbi:Septum formation [Arthrobacter sp. yr096]|uniref:septum formation family protein n=1 Tax=Arthrobacter sp. cf158 TaxID=1761744 RepID=UPI000897A9A5|nr:septum formation family protein [Arthrobacter sp. cf158]SDX09055.1 Septum formation [Arthrobacter sp. cf158]SEJ66893.1 Septum formation [Arthrobacter sp. yr096]
MLHLSKSLRAAAALCCVSIALAGCSLISSGDAKRDESGKPTESSVADVFKVKIGDCIAQPKGEQFRNVSVIPCDQGHDLEAFATKDLEDSSYPGDSALVTRSEEYCVAEFATFVGKAFDESVLEMMYFHPSRETWSAGDREIVCLAGGTSGASITGTLKGAAR